ncbi:glycosyltransferase family 25 protein [Shewanella sp. 202IG2-18]|uniref:glycosyltransferase family 25 protein n=1 Tax=Parashewanella hymeniacidonis TaxID=2807618 RepID=UPI0019613A61|nr:glycosyltransferase family 25 protein [Parashewanella hymeniacidonis]MBM7071095.1 glycosyltransferase family 25 protein [Parashewanella hymeniacidonis]
MEILTFVINMPHNTDRKNNVLQQLSSLNISATFTEAVVGKTLSKDEVKQLYNKELNQRHYHRDLSIGEIGCYASHRQIWQEIAAKKINWAVILEDDITISKSINQALESLQYIKSADIIKLSDNRNNKAADSRFFPNKVTCVSYKRIPNCTTGYIISLDGAKKLLSRTQIFRPVDIDMQFHSELNLTIIGLKPYSISEAGFDSEIALQNKNGKHSNSSTFWRNAKHRLRMIIERQKASADLKKVIS